jgi:hypothetical protein
MSGTYSISIALETRLSLIASPLATEYENVPYTPVAGTPYQSLNLLLNTPVNAELSARYQEQGFLQVTLHYPVGTGKADALVKAQAIREWFYRGLSLAASDVIVTIGATPIIGVAQIDDGNRYAIPVKIPFIAQSN